MVETAILSKIRKLLKLAADPSNPHEAALAAERAQELLFRHKLEMADVSEDTFEDVIAVDRPYINVMWRKMLAAVLARFNFCRLLEWSGGMKFIGSPADVETVLYLYVYLSRTIYRLARESWETRVADFTDPILGRHPTLDEEGAEEAWKDSFRIGAVEIIGVRLQRARQTQEAMARYDARTSGGEQALVHVGRTLQALDDRLASYIDQKFGPVTQLPEPEVGINLDAFASGVHTGQSLPLSKGIGSGRGRGKLNG